MKKFLLLIIVVFLFSGCEIDTGNFVNQSNMGDVPAIELPSVSANENDDVPENDTPEKPENTKKPQQTDSPKKTDEPQNTDTPKETDTPKQTENSKPTETPKSTDKPKNIDKPASTQAPVSSGNYSGFSTAVKGWGYRKLEGKRPEFSSSQADEMNKSGSIYLGNASDKVMYLTFDEGYELGYTAKILDVLKKCNVKAAFFITGPYLEKNADLVSRMINEGHIVGNHTYNHPNLAKLTTVEAVQEDVLKLERAFTEKYGKKMKYLRPPEGAYSEKSLMITKDLGYTNVFWSFAYKDWETNNQKGSNYAFEQVTKYFHNGAVILLHAVSKDNADALESILNDAKKKGFIFKSLDAF